MNLLQAHSLVRLLLDAQPLLPHHWEEGDPRPTTEVALPIECEKESLVIRLRCYDDTLVNLPEYLFIDPEGVLHDYDADHDRLVPCRIRWRYGAGVERWRDNRYYRYLDVHPVEEAR
ncbi:MAG: hypothetical protein ACRDJY_03215 [Thermoleophilaceae bacterium]